jgi:hypothetical protein
MYLYVLDLGSCRGRYAECQRFAGLRRARLGLERRPHTIGREAVGLAESNPSIPLWDGASATRCGDGRGGCGGGGHGGRLCTLRSAHCRTATVPASQRPSVPASPPRLILRASGSGQQCRSWCEGSSASNASSASSCVQCIELRPMLILTSALQSRGVSLSSAHLTSTATVVVHRTVLHTPCRTLYASSAELVVLVHFIHLAFSRLPSSPFVAVASTQSALQTFDGAASLY